MQFTRARPSTVQQPQRALVISQAKFRPQSRIGKKLIQVPKGVDVKIDDYTFTCKVRLPPIRLPHSTCVRLATRCLDRHKRSNARSHGARVHTHLAGRLRTA